MKLPEKIAAFCRELNHDELLMLAEAEGMADVLQRAMQRVLGGDIGPLLEGDLNALHVMVTRVDPQGLFSSSRQYSPVRGGSGSSGAEWWECPGGLCAGRGLVRSGHSAPRCGVDGRSLVARAV